MKAALDSSYDRPSPAQAAAARQAGVRMWWGYLATDQRPGSFNLAAPWRRADFDVVRQAGLGAGAFVSGWDDPDALRRLGAAWGISALALDDEAAIRGRTMPDWRPTFLARLGGGLYGGQAAHDIAAPFHIAALYPAGGCPGATWPPGWSRPATPCGWQCQGTHTELGLSVDRMVLDDAIGGRDVIDLQNDPVARDWNQKISDMWAMLQSGAPFASSQWKDPATFTGDTWPTTELKGVMAALEALSAQLATIPAGGGLTAAQAQQLAYLTAAVARLSSHLGVGTA